MTVMTMADVDVPFLWFTIHNFNNRLKLQKQTLVPSLTILLHAMSLTVVCCVVYEE
jgi:hypothetical protein